MNSLKINGKVHRIKDGYFIGNRVVKLAKAMGKINMSDLVNACEATGVSREGLMEYYILIGYKVSGFQELFREVRFS